VSVVIATYNGRPFIHDQLQSLVSQTHPPLEIVICDDGSTDGTVEEIERFAATSPVPILLHRNEARLGYADNFLKGAGLSRGDYIAFSDQDDIWLPQKLAKCIGFIVENEVALCAHAVRVVSHEGQDVSLMDQGIKTDGLIAPLTSDPWGVYFGFSQVFHRSLLDLIPPSDRGVDSYNFQNVLSHDRWTFFLASNFFPIGALSETLVNYRQHSSNLFGANELTVWDRFLIKTKEGPARLAQFADLAKHRVMMLQTNRSERLAPMFDRAIARWKSIAYFCDLRVRLYSNRHLPMRLFYLAQAICTGAYLPFRFRGLGPKRLLEDASLGLFGSYFALWQPK
jgi:glycosyltransferase involved in cell wall biosynthesis